MYRGWQANFRTVLVQQGLTLVPLQALPSIIGKGFRSSDAKIVRFQFGGDVIEHANLELTTK
jgi:hypothetical protein